MTLRANKPQPRWPISQIHDAKDPSAAFSARVVSSKDLSLNKVRNYPFDPDFYVANGGPAVRYEFSYDKGLPRMVFRVVTSFGADIDFFLSNNTERAIHWNKKDRIEMRGT
jgi:hypothetical protein